MLIAALSIPAWLALAPSSAAHAPPAGLLAEVERIAASSPWPGFDVRRVPIEVYDGERTWLIRHPSPPAGFARVEGMDGVYVSEGRHPSVRANTNVDLGGVGTATAMLDAGGRSAEEAAALVVHEMFHVFQRERHADWSGNEADLFTYPFDDAASLGLARLEAEALSRAVRAAAPDDAARWARRAIAARRDRFARLPKEAAAYERGTELNEGLANYVQVRAGRKDPAAALPAEVVPAEEVRRRCYATGLAWALLLDRQAPGWRERLEAGPTRPLDEILAEALGGGEAAAFTREEEAAEEARARGDVESLKARREERRRSFLERDGWTIVLINEGSEPLWPQGFDPLNVLRLSEREVLHSRYVKVGNGAGTLEVLDAPSLTEGAGSHPLFNGIRRVTVAGIDAEPAVEEAAGVVRLKGGGVAAELRGARVERSGRTLTFRLGPPPGRTPSAPQGP